MHVDVAKKMERNRKNYENRTPEETRKTDDLMKKVGLNVDNDSAGGSSNWVKTLREQAKRKVDKENAAGRPLGGNEDITFNVEFSSGAFSGYSLEIVEGRTYSFEETGASSTSEATSSSVAGLSSTSTEPETNSVGSKEDDEDEEVVTPDYYKNMIINDIASQAAKIKKVPGWHGRIILQGTNAGELLKGISDRYKELTGQNVDVGTVGDFNDTVTSYNAGLNIWQEMIPLVGGRCDNYAEITKLQKDLDSFVKDFFIYTNPLVKKLKEILNRKGTVGKPIYDVTEEYGNYDNFFFKGYERRLENLMDGNRNFFGGDLKSNLYMALSAISKGKNILAEGAFNGRFTQPFGTNKWEFDAGCDCSTGINKEELKKRLEDVEKGFDKVFTDVSNYNGKAQEKLRAMKMISEVQENPEELPKIIADADSEQADAMKQKAPGNPPKKPKRSWFKRLLRWLFPCFFGSPVDD